MADLQHSRLEAPVASAAERRDTGKAFKRHSFHWCLALLGVAAALSVVALWAPLLLASWFAVAVRPLHAKLAQHIGGRSRAAGVLTVLLVVAALLPLIALALSLVGSTADAIEQLKKADGMGDALRSVLTSEPQGASGAFDVRQLGALVQRHGDEAWRAVTLVFGAASAAAVGTVVFLYGFYTCLVDGKRAYEWLIEHSPLAAWQTKRLAAAYEETGRGLLIGVGLTALFQGAVATVGYLIIGVPRALVFGLLTALAALIPSIGTALVWAPVSIALFVAGRTGAGAAVLGLGAVVSVADNFVRPLLSKHASLALPSFVLFVAMLGGIAVFGPWGLLAGPLFVRLVVEALRIGRAQRELGPSAAP